MKPRFYASVLLLTMSIGVASAAPSLEPDYLTKEQVLTLPLPELTKRILQDVALNFVEVSRPTSINAETSIDYFDLATAPSEIEPGLCVATVLHVHLDHPLYAPPYDHELPPKVAFFSTEDVFKIIADTHRSGTVRHNNSTKSCQEIRPILRTNNDIGFFNIQHSDHPNNISTAYKAMILAVANAYAKDTKLTCNPSGYSADGVKSCADIPALLASLKLSDLTEIGFAPCLDQLGMYCIEASIHRKPLDAPIEQWNLELRVRLRHPGDVPADVDHIDSITVYDVLGGD